MKLNSTHLNLNETISKGVLLGNIARPIRKYIFSLITFFKMLTKWKRMELLQKKNNKG